MPAMIKARVAAVLIGGLLAASLATAAPKLPRLKSGKPDFSGIWETTSAAEYDLEPHSGRADAPPSAGVIDGKYIPYLPAALEQKKKNFAARGADDPRLKCWTLGTPRGIYYREPFQIFQRDRDLTLLFQFGRYLLISSSRPGTQPANLQGIWNDSLSPSWDSKYTINANLPQITVDGVPVVVTVSGDGHTATGAIGGETIFTLTIDPIAKTYKFEIFSPIDNNPDGAKLTFGTDAAVYPYGQGARQFAYMVRFGMTPARRSARRPPRPPRRWGWSARSGRWRRGSRRT